MELIFLDELLKLSGYRKRQSVKTWLAGMNLRLLRIGKNYAVDKDAFEREFVKRHKITMRKKKCMPVQKTEREFLAEVEFLLSTNTEL